MEGRGGEIREVRAAALHYAYWYGSGQDIQSCDIGHMTTLFHLNL